MIIIGNKYINRISTIEDANNYLKNSGVETIKCIKYVGNLHDKSYFKCKKDGYEWETSLYYVAKVAKQCPMCSKRGRIKNIDDVNKWLKDNNKSIICLYYAGTSSNKNSKFKCMIDGYEWTSSLGNIKNSDRGCAECANLKKIKTIEEVNDWIKNNNKNFICTEYIGNVRESSVFHCNNCNKTWKSTFNNIKNGNGCPHCHSSKGEKQIANILDLNNIPHQSEYCFEDCRNINPLPFDFAIFNLNNELIGLCEYQGIQHYEPVDFAAKGEKWANELFVSNQFKDKIKKDYCASKNIPLLEIPYWEFNNIEEKLKKFLHKYAA